MFLVKLDKIIRPTTIHRLKPRRKMSSRGILLCNYSRRQAAAADGLMVSVKADRSTAINQVAMKSFAPGGLDGLCPIMY